MKAYDVRGGLGGGTDVEIIRSLPDPERTSTPRCLYLRKYQRLCTSPREVADVELGVGYTRHKAFNLNLELRSPALCDDCGFSFLAVDSSVSNPDMRRGGAGGGR